MEKKMGLFTMEDMNSIDVSVETVHSDDVNGYSWWGAAASAPFVGAVWWGAYYLW